MAIRQKYDVAGVVIPDNKKQKEFGQKLVLQQKQQEQEDRKLKYAAQQAGYDRLLTVGRDQFQNDMAFRRENRQNEFLTEQQKRQQQAADFAAARSRIDTHAKDMLANGDIKDPGTRQKIQNLIAGKTIVMGSGFDETARQNYLDQYNAELAKILSEVPQPKAPPTPDEEIAGLPEINGTKYQKNKSGVWEPLSEPKERLLQQQQQQKEMEQLRPKSAQEYYGANEDQFRKDLEATKKSLQEQKDDETYVGDVTDEAAWERMQKDYEFRQNALGKSQFGTPTAAPKQPGASAASPPPQMRSILEQQPAGPAAGPQWADDKWDDGWDGVADAQGLPPGAAADIAPGQAADPNFGTGPATPVGQPLSILGSAKDEEVKQKWMEGSPVPTVTVAPPPTQQQILDDKVSQLGPEARVEYDAMMRKRAEATAGGVPPPPLPDVSSAFGATGQSEVIATGEGKKSKGVAEAPASSPSQRGITLESALMAAKQYETSSQQLKSLQAQAADIEEKIQLAWSPALRNTDQNKNPAMAALKKEQQRIKGLMQSAQSAMEESDKSVRGYDDQQVAQQPAAKKLSESGKRPQDYAEAEFQLRSLRQQYPDIASMPAEAKKKLKEAMSVIQAGR
jgi:hypothetical protein